MFISLMKKCINIKHYKNVLDLVNQQSSVYNQRQILITNMSSLSNQSVEKKRKELENKVTMKKSNISEVDEELMKSTFHNQSQNVDIQLDSWWLYHENEIERESGSCAHHSERLALAYNFIMKPNTTFIQITNNIRICHDCHQFMKQVAKIRQCEIVIRDPNRIHRFSTNGECSCKDHF
ncbi:hypothetical protein I4U23_031353 [Adineta vaga]|nr:hypothetical protein I4U23_031353 [Adineta vaga]